jgi:hypothetical protein
MKWSSWRVRIVRSVKSLGSESRLLELGESAKAWWDNRSDRVMGPVMSRFNAHNSSLSLYMREG